MNKKPLSPDFEKRQNRFIFCCIGLILYAMPCMSCLMIPILSEGFTPAMTAALITVAAGVAEGFLGMNRFKVKKGRPVLILSAAVILALHILTAFLLRTWYIILAPELILLVLLMLWSDVIPAIHNAE